MQVQRLDRRRRGKDARFTVDTERVDDRRNISTQQHEPSPPTLARNDIGRIALTLAQPIFAEPYDANRVTGSFILVDDVTNNTVAAGMVR